jgi:hypothetical protein
MKAPTLVCGDHRRREEVRKRELNGLDYVEVSDDGLTLTLYFLGKAPRDVEAGNVRIEGGRRITGIGVVGVTPHYRDDPDVDDRLDVQLDGVGDFSTYAVRMVERDQHGRSTGQTMRGFDRRYARAEFSFRACCDTDLDCAATTPCPTPQPQAPAIDYLAKDYLGFRRLMLDRLAVLIPEWRERHVPDLGIALVELLAYVGDHLSYYQDAVATEAYLEPARERISVRRHARLVDYRLHEGCNARTFVCVETDGDLTLAPEQCCFITEYDGAPAGDGFLSDAILADVPPASYEVFEPLRGAGAATIGLRAGHSRIRFYTWGDRECCLPRGATSATLLDEWGAGAAKGHEDRPLALRPNDFLLLEEVMGARTGDPADADPTRRQVVRLTRVHRGVDQLTGTHIVDVEWCSEDALTFALCLSSTGRAPECRPLDDVSVACGNVIAVDHGRTIIPPEDLGQVPGEPLPATCDPCDDAGGGFAPGRYRPTLSGTPLTFGQPATARMPAVRLLDQDPRQATPHIGLQAIPPLPDHSGPLFTPGELRDPALLVAALRDPQTDRSRELRARISPETAALLGGAGDASPALVDALRGELTGWLDAWSPEYDLLASLGDDRQFVVETDNDGIAHLRLGDGDLGRAPEVGAGFVATYRVGNGPAGNVGAGTITRLVLVGEQVSGVSLRVWNPLAARGGTAPETIAEAKLMAPGAFRSELARAITPADYATLAGDDPRLQGAAATLAWTGSWYEVQVAIDEKGEDAADPALCDRTRARLERFRRIGHDLRVSAARLVPIDLALLVCVLPHFGRAEVKAALLEVLGTRRRPDGRLGFFHPDSLGFGGAVELSRIVAAAQAVPGVESVTVERLERLFAGPDGELDTGLLRLRPDEVARLSNDPSFPEHGRLRLTLRGGR